MKIIKKVIALFLTIALFPTVAMFSVNAESIDITETEEYKKLVAFGIIEKNNDELKYYEYITRELFVTYLMRSLGQYVTYSENTENIFADMSDASAEAANAVSAAVGLGLVSRSPDGNFRPKDKITMNEAAKLLTTVLGYSALCEKNGGYPNAYLAKAHQLDLFEGCKFSQEGYISAVDYIKMLMNTLETKVVCYENIFNRNGTPVVEFGDSDGEMLMQLAFDIYKTEGIVTSDEYVSISGPSEVGENQIAINSVNYYCNGENLSQFLGCCVECYYSYDRSADRRNVIYINLHKNKNEITQINASDISVDTTAEVFKYSENDRDNKTIDIPKSATLIYNGGIKAITASLLKPAHGDVTFIDNDNDNVIDVVKVMSYRIIKVASVTEVTHRIADDLGGAAIELDPEDGKFAIRIIKDGEEVSFSDIDADNVISYAQSEGNSVNVKYVIVSDARITGNITAIGDETAEIDGIEYEFDDDIFAGLKTGQSGTFYLDHKNEVVAKTTNDDTVFGYLNKIGTSGTLKKKIAVRIFTENSKWVTLELCQNVKHNGGRVSDDDFYRKCINLGSGDAYRQLVSYTVNGEGKVNRIDFAEDCLTPGTATEQVMIQNDTFRKSLTSAQKTYRNLLPSFDNDCILTSSTKIFMIPDQSLQDADEDEFWMTNSGALTADKKYSNITAYNMDEMRIAEVIVSEGNPPAVDVNGDVVLVNRILYKRIPDGDFAATIEGLYKGIMMTAYVKDDTVLAAHTNLGSGDVVQLSVNSEGYVNKISMVLDYEPEATLSESVSREDGYQRTVTASGDVTNIDYQNELYMIDVNGTKYIFGLYSNGYSILVYDTETEEMYPGTFADIEIGDAVFAKVRYFASENIVVYK